ncbi:MAG: hypothetical protein CMQ20_11860 [Gammaproteobacteria bacterium]|nr:hypothetical protein [Gammaproteobacteria bacterium]|tara:strand:- start:72 stop:1427 length:1356 start_codon:yes stop_codon:yes gene_type:complete
MPFPLKINVSTSLIVDIHVHEFYLGDRVRQCWTYLTTGLVECGQKEMSLSLLMEDDDDEDNYPKTPIKIFQLLENYAQDGKVVDIADATRLGKTGLFGFTALYYLPAIQFEGLPDCQNHLALVLVHQAEYEFAKRYGFTRLLSRIGKFCSCFPYPTWNTRRRPSLFAPGLREDSVLNDHNLIPLNGMQAELVEDVVCLTLHTSDQHRLSQCLDKLAGEDKSFALQTGLSQTANACLFWEPGQANPGAYTAPDEVTRIGAAFIIFEVAETSYGCLVEDGFLFSLSKQNLKMLTSCCESRTDSGILESSGLRLSVQWGEEGFDAPQPAIAYHHLAGWTELATSAASDAQVNRIELKSIVDISPDARSKVNTRQLDRYVEDIQTFLLSSMSEESEELTLTIRVDIQNNFATYEINADMDLNPDFRSYMVRGLAKVRPCAASAPVIFDLVFAINS